MAKGGRAGYSIGSVVNLAPKIPGVKPLFQKGAEIIGGTALGKRLSDTFFSKDKDEGEKKKDADPDDKNILKRPDPNDPRNLDDLRNSLEVLEAVERRIKKAGGGGIGYMLGE